ncbi:hypothetical protein [Streptomyces sp. NPDC048442]|uniref:hypothetical protein n=1 Tax=Streptomyces sp. NPDC048442 TaxID=3154823 RepID=UPI003445740C
MRDRIAHTLAQVLSVLALWACPRRPGRHTAAYLAAQPAPAPGPAPVSPWSQPWTGPSKEEARRIFELQAEASARLLARQEERRLALHEAALGREYPYSYPGAPFPRAAFVAGMAAAA